MTTRFIEASIDASPTADQPAALWTRARTSVVRYTRSIRQGNIGNVARNGANVVRNIGLRSFMTTAQHTLTIFGMSAVALVVLLMARPDLAKQLSISLFGDHAAPAADTGIDKADPAPTSLVAQPATDALPLTPAVLTANQRAQLATQKQQQWVTSWLSRRYRVAGDAANMLVSTAYTTARDIKLDPLLILAVMAIESGLNPFAESPVGAKGLMQVMASVHHDKFQEVGGVQAALNPAANIRVGSLILKDYVTRGGSVEAGLKSYVGAAAFQSDDGYGSRVLAEYRRLKQVSTGKNVPIFTPMASAAPVALKVVVPEVKHEPQIAGI